MKYDTPRALKPKPRSGLYLSVSAALAIGCSFIARSPERYRDDTTALLASKNPEIIACYERVLLEHPEARGTVTARFTIQEETGRITDVAIDNARTDAPEPLADCVRSGVNGLVLHPPDARDGHAAFAWQFVPGETSGG